MKPRLHTRQFSTGAKWLHWLVAVFMLSIIPTAIGFSTVAPADRAEAIPVHASIGLIVLMLTLVRLGWRAVYPPPETPEASPHWVKRGASVGHFLLYALVLWQATLGIWMAASSTSGIRFFNMFNLTELAPANIELIAQLRPLHLAGAWLLVLALVGHVAGAFWHHLKLRDDVLVRMLPFGGLWQRLTAHDYAQRWRFPSTHLKNWPKRMPE